MSKSQFLGLLGSLLLIGGVFAPVINYPVLGDLTFLKSGTRGGYALIAVGVVALILALIRQTRWLWLPGLAALALLVLRFFRMQSGMSKALASIQAAGADSTRAGAVVSGSIHFQWGWIVLLLGSVLIIAAGAIHQDPEV